MNSFIKETPSDLYIQALKKTQVKVISKKNLMALINSTESFQTVWVQLLEREWDLLILSPRRALQACIGSQPTIIPSYPQERKNTYFRRLNRTLNI